MSIKTAKELQEAFKEQLGREFSLLRMITMTRVLPETGEIYVFSQRQGKRKLMFAAGIQRNEFGQISNILTDVR